MPDEPTQIEQERSEQLSRERGSSFGARAQSLKERGRAYFQRSRGRRIQVRPPDIIEYGLIFFIAIFNDVVLDYFTGLGSVTGVWAIVLRAIDVGTLALLLPWAYFRGVSKSKSTKTNQLVGGVSGRMKKWVVAAVLEFLFGEIVPAWTASVILSYLEHQKAYQAAEKERQRARRLTAYEQREAREASLAAQAAWTEETA